MNYIQILLRLHKLKKILFSIFLIFMACGYILQKDNSKEYAFYVDIYFPLGSFLTFEAKEEIYKNFKNAILTELTKKNYTIKQKPNIANAYRISAPLITANKNKDFLKKKKEITSLFQKQKKNLILRITNNYNVKNITLQELQDEEIAIDTRRRIKLQLMWMDLEKEFVYENISESNNLKFPKKMPLKNVSNYYAIMTVLYIAFLILFITYLIITDDIKKKIKRLKRPNKK